MELKNFFAQDAQGNKLPGAICYLYHRGAESLATGLQKANGVALLNPFTADNDGLVQLAAPNGLYDLRVISDQRDYRLPVQYIDVAEHVGLAQAASTMAVTARDAALQAKGVFTSMAKALLGTVNDEFFSLVSSDPNESVILYRNNAGVPLEETRYSSAAAVQRATNIARRANYLLSGRATKITKVGGTKDWTVSWGRLYIFTGTGKTQAYVQPVTDLVVPDGKCAYVDLSEPLVDGEYIVHVSALSLLTTANPPGSYIDDSKIILFTCLNDIIGGELYPQYQAVADGAVSRSSLSLAQQNIADRAGWHVIGKATKLQPLVSTPTSYTISFPELIVTGGATFAAKKVAPVVDTNVAVGEALYVDLDGALNANGQLVAQVTSGGFTAGMTTTGAFISDRKVYLFINGTSGLGGPLAQQQISLGFMDDTLKNRSARAAYQVVGDLSAFAMNGSTGVLSFNDLRVPRGVGITTLVVAGMTDVSVPLGQALFVDLSSAPVGGKLVAQVTTAGYTSNAGNISTGAFIDDTKVYLFINDQLGHAGVLAGRKPTNVNVYLGEVWMKTTPTNIIFDPATRTLSWDNYLILPMLGGQGRIKLAAGSYTFSNTTFNVAYLDLSATVTSGDTPASAVKGGQYYDATNAERFRGSSSQLPLFYWNGATDFGSLGGFPPASAPGAGVPSALAADDVVVKVGNNTISVFVKGAKSGSKKYLEQTIGYENKPFDPTGVDAFGNSDLWRLKHQYECDLTASTMSFTRTRAGQALLNGGELTCAIKQKGADDYIGGYHGDEIKTYALLLLDGVEIPFNTVATYIGKKLTLIQHSKLFKWNTQEEVATHSKRETLSHADGGLKIDMVQQVTWSQVLELEAAMLTMLPIKRLIADTTGEVITNAAMRAPYASKEDVSTTGFAQVTTLGSLPDCQLWGPTGISASIQMLKHPGFDDCGFYIASPQYYNKPYYSVAGSKVSTMGGVTHLTAIGETWDVESVIRMTTTN
ncbi:hypothetical protein [Pseudomonas violetae]|uniref:Uncharacterized protein n=1 Tax=Pseudomonas violetae TaxID=2915813 RepID=A0ABT0F8I9_9PSED|nr:hypothetical protein [Pseudomonas violetae]MCK1794295.1 hypothetical protein [Pseudomonas violetae]